MQSGGPPCPLTRSFLGLVDSPQNWIQHLRVASLGRVVCGTKLGTEPGLNTQYSRSVRAQVQIDSIRCNLTCIRPGCKWGEKDRTRDSTFRLTGWALKWIRKGLKHVFPADNMDFCIMVDDLFSVSQTGAGPDPHSLSRLCPRLGLSQVDSLTVGSSHGIDEINVETHTMQEGGTLCLHAYCVCGSCAQVYRSGG